MHKGLSTWRVFRPCLLMKNCVVWSLKMDWGEISKWWWFLFLSHIFVLW